MEKGKFLRCFSCMSANDSYLYEETGDTYASMVGTCFEIKIPTNLKYMCQDCADHLEKAVSFKEQIIKSLAVWENELSQEEEYLDETILEAEETITQEEPEMDNTDTVSVKKDSDVEDCEENEENVDDPQYYPSPQCECHLCGLTVEHLEQHLHRCHSSKSEPDNRKYPCHFCDNVYINKKACFTHLRMKHGLKLSTDQTPKFLQRERQMCHVCNRDFSQKQILNKHLWKVHGLEVDKRKAFVCPLCSERVSYGTNFSAHLLHEHHVQEQVESLQFCNMEDFLVFKSAMQDETKFRFRKTTASKLTIEGVRSHYMCSQSGVYVYQGKGKRQAPERQIYKTGKACPAHMIVTETMDNVLVTFYKTHVGHGPCPYYKPREPKRAKMELPSTSYVPTDLNESTVEDAAVCDLCGLVCTDTEHYRAHASTHTQNTLPCQYCKHDFKDIDAWSHHIRVFHKMAILY